MYTEAKMVDGVDLVLWPDQPITRAFCGVDDEADCPSSMRARQGESLDRYHIGDRIWEIDTSHDLMIVGPRAIRILREVAQNR
jgi:hypothetical protein